MNGDKPSVYLKRNKIAELFDYCMDNGISFNVQERTMGIDEFEVTMDVENIKKAIQLGIFLKENRMELAGSSAEAKPAVKKPVARKVVEAPAPNPLLAVTPEKSETKAPVATPEVFQTQEAETPIAEEEKAPAQENVSLSFDLN